MSNFITPNELLPIMDEVIILDARGFQDYKRGHIKGAFPVDIDKDLTGPIGEHGGRHPLPDMEQLLWWTLRYMGLKDVRVLSGGIERWVKEGHLLTKDPTPLPTEPTTFNYTLQTDMTMSRNEVLEASKSGSHVIVDARAPERYDGSVVDVMDGMTGHIPGAVNHFYESGYTSEGPRSIKDLENEFYNEIYQQKPVVTYCGSGVTACNTLLVMSEAGLNSALYVGSSSDWVTYDEFPIQTGVETL
ncbi:MAG: rhodanese-like domain-containing protein [Veillonella sp.]|nr:rhodanese-like domain-containing protein [Veillonella sp.]